MAGDGRESLMLMAAYSIYGNPKASFCIIRLTGEHEKEIIEQEIADIREHCDKNIWCIVTVPVSDWDYDMAPWPSNSICSDKNKTGADAMLGHIVENIIEEIENNYPLDDRKYYIAGYSLAGLFSLWAAYQTDVFEGVAAVSPSVWYPGWMEYADIHHILAENVYLSLGKKESKTRNIVMATVADNIENIYISYTEMGINTVLEWNEGNHFKDVASRMAKGELWLINAANENKKKINKLTGSFALLR